MYRSTSFLVLDGGALGLLSEVDDHQGTGATTVRVTFQYHPRRILQAISALEDDEQLLGCCGMADVPDLVHVS